MVFFIGYNHPEASLTHLELCPDVFGCDFGLPNINCHLLSASENYLNSAGMLLADWLVCESNAVTYSKAVPNKEFLLEFSYFSSHIAWKTPLPSPTGPRGIACNSMGWHTRRHRHQICAYTVVDTQGRVRAGEK